MTRVEADELVAALDEYVEARHDIARWWPDTPEAEKATVLSLAARERLIDRLCGEERTDALPGRAP